jgi:hypothetical protein
MYSNLRVFEGNKNTSVAVERKGNGEQMVMGERRKEQSFD